MNWFSKMWLGSDTRFSPEHDRSEPEADEGSASMFTILGPLSQRTDPSPRIAVSMPRAAQAPRMDAPRAVQPQPVMKTRIFFDDTAYFNETESLNFR